MNTSSAITDSSRDVHAVVALLAEQREEAWFDEAPASTRRPSSIPPASGVIRIGEFLGDPLADAWLR
mgnify:CR=1 FL=1